MTAELITPRFRLRPFQAEDLERLFTLYGDARVMAIRKIGTQSRAETQGQMAEILRHWRERGFGLYGIYARADGAFLGECGLREARPGADEIELSYGLLPEAWGQSVASEVARAMVAHGFATLGLAEILAMARADNAASLHILEKLGFTKLADIAEGKATVVKSLLRRSDWERGMGRS